MAKKAASSSSKKASTKAVEALKHADAKRKNIPTAEYSAMHGNGEEQQSVHYKRNRDLDPQLMWRGKDEQDWSDLVVNAPPLYIQEKVHAKALVDDLLRQTREKEHAAGELMADLFADFNGIPKGADRTEFYQHDQNWTNRMILGDSLQVMASLAEREGLRGKVQCIYLDPPYGIEFNSNFQWSTTTTTVTDGKAQHITRDPEQVKAFRDTWRDGIHSYLTYLRDRFFVCRDLLSESGSIFVQISAANSHRVRLMLDEVFGHTNFVSQIGYHSTSGSTSEHLSNPKDFVLWYARDKSRLKFRRLLVERSFSVDDPGPWQIVEDQGRRLRLQEFLESGGNLTGQGVRIARLGDATSQRQGRESGDNSAMGFPFGYNGREFRPSGTRGWSTTRGGLERAARAARLHSGGKTLSLVRFFDESPFFPLTSSWEDTGGTIGADKVYVVQTNVRVIQRCVLMASDPGDIVLDPTCGSGTTAYVAEQWGRRWITIDTSRVALALARARIMGARYPSYLLADSREGQIKEAEVTRSTPSNQATRGDIRQGFVYERVPHITLKSIANNAEIDVIWDRWQEVLEPLRAELNSSLKKSWDDWEVPRDVESSWPAKATKTHTEWWEARIARQREIDSSIAAKADYEYLCDRPYEDKKKVRVAGPFTVESLSPHRVVSADEISGGPDAVAERTGYTGGRDFPSMVLDNLRIAGVQQAEKKDRITFTSLHPWPGDLVCAEGRYGEGSKEQRAAIFIGPEFGTVTRPDLVSAAREAAESGFDVLVACAFNFEAHTTEFDKLGKVPVLKARMNADLHMAEDLRTTDKANLFVIFGEPDLEIIDAGKGRIKVKVRGVDVFDPRTGEIRSDDPDNIACWFVDTDYNEESFFVRHAYFLGANDPYRALKTTLKADVDEEAWESLRSDTSRPFERPKSGRIAVKVINHLGDEVMKVFRV